jgi:hypothetical protein
MGEWAFADFPDEARAAISSGWMFYDSLGEFDKADLVVWAEL